jgi:hypothetical protein
LDAEVFGVAISDRVNEAVAIDDVRVYGPAIKTLEARRHEQRSRASEVAERSLIGLRGRDVGLVDNDEVDIFSLQLPKNVVGLSTSAKGMKIRDDDVSGEQLIARDIFNGLVAITVEGLNGWRFAAGDERPTR